MLRQVSFLLGFLVALVGIGILTDSTLWTTESVALGLLLLTAGVGMISGALARPVPQMRRA